MICIKCKKEMPDGSTFCPWCGKKQVREPRKTMKRANGTGTVYKLTDKRRRRPWVASKNKVIIGYYDTKTAALEAIESLSGRDLSARYNMTYADAFKEWSAEHYRTVGESGKSSYQTAFAINSVQLHGKKMRDLRTPDYQACIDKLAADGRSQSTMEKLKQLFGQMSRWAVREEICTTDFAKFVKVPTQKKKEKEIFTEEDIKTLWSDSSSSATQVILIMIYTGVRIGELFSVPKSDVNIQDGYMVGGEKTESGRDRIIPFPEKVMPFVVDMYKNARDGGKLIDGYRGKNKDPYNFRKREYYPTLDRLGIKRITPHGTRHTYITRAIKQGVDMDELIRLVGHVDKDTTKLYLHDEAETIRNMVKDMQ